MRVRLLVDLGNLLARPRQPRGGRAGLCPGRPPGPDEAGRLIVQLNQGVLALHARPARGSGRRVSPGAGRGERGYLGVKYQSACHYNLGVAYQRQGQDAQATLAFNAVLDTWPATEYARYAASPWTKRKQKSGTEKNIC